MSISKSLLTKVSVVTYTDEIPTRSYKTDFFNVMDIIFKEMADANKTDNLPVIDIPNKQVTRHWLDEAAVNEFKSNLEYFANFYDVPITSITISDL